MRYLKLPVEQGEKRALYEAVKESDLYDGELSMYKVNASLADSSFELGRARAFTPGWLENESIWLHMEYKYLLELLRSGLYEEFFADFKKAAIPFQNPETYGRSIYENSSFIASSRNPNPSCRGRGFVARLSGSTDRIYQHVERDDVRRTSFPDGAGGTGLFACTGHSGVSDSGGWQTFRCVYEQDDRVL